MLCNEYVPHLLEHVHRYACTAPNLRSQDPQTKDRTWIAAAALHVYVDRPSSAPGTAAAPHIGLKVLRYPNIHQPGCGPNFCCCLVPYD